MIDVRDVSKSFGRVVALSGVSLRIDPGERVALCGSNGSGKSTLLRAICGLLQVTGEVRVLGADVRREPARALRAVAYIPQTAPPLDAPVRELVRAYEKLRGIAPEHVARVAARLGLPLTELAPKRVRDLSGGTKQKLLAALALASETSILICDEPTASLDHAAREAFAELLAERAPESILVVCSHRESDLSPLLSRTVELADGRVIRDAAHAALHPHASAVPTRRAV